MKQSLPSGAPFSLLLRNCRVVDVYTGEIRPGNIAIQDGKIVATNALATSVAVEEIDCEEMYAVPGMIDAHMHVDTTFLWPGEVARAIVPLGTTTLFVDTTNIAHTGGAAAVTALIKSFDGLPIRGLFASPSYCPLSRELETAAVEITSKDIEGLLEGGCVSIGETVWSKIGLGDDDFFRGIQICRSMGRRVSGHGGEIPTDDEAAFDGFVAAGIQDDHCLLNGGDILPRIRRGLRLFCVEAPGRIGALRKILTRALELKIPLRHLCLCVDNINIMDLVGAGFGYQDHLVRIALEVGVPPVDAYRMATLNPAEHYRVTDRIGSLTPGRCADILLLKALDTFPPELVIVGGKVVARRGVLTVEIPKPNFPESFRHSIDLHLVKRSSFALKASAAAKRVRVRVIKVRDGEVFNSAVEEVLPVIGGVVQPDVARDILRMVVVERYGRNGNVGGGLVRGFGLMRGAIATSLSVPSNNLVAVGTSDEEIWFALRRLEENQGAFVAVADGKVLAEALLPIGGIMAEAPFESTMADIRKADAAARELGCPLTQPFYTMVETVLSTLPDFGLTDKGLVSSIQGKTVPVIMEEMAS